MNTVEDDIAELGASIEAGKAAAAEKALGGEKPAAEQSGGLVHWMKNLPANVGVGLMDAAISMYDTVSDDPEPTANERRMAPSDAVSGPGQVAAVGRQLEQGDLDVRQAAGAFRNLLATDASRTSDAITQSAAQFVIPFMGWSKAFSGFKAAAEAPKLAQVAGKVAQTVAAESATMATAFDPHAGRLADLLEFGKHTEGKFGDALHALAPDGSALNAYIDYMTDREDESAAEGRLKNVVDGLAGSAVVSSVLKVGAKAFRGARAFAQSPIKLPDIGAPDHLSPAAVDDGPPSLADVGPFSDDIAERLAEKEAIRISEEQGIALADEAFAKFPDSPHAAMVHLTEQADNALEDDVSRSQYLTAAEIARGKVSDKGIVIVPTEEGHTVVIGKQPSLTFLKEEDALAAVADARRFMGGAFEKRAVAEHAKASDKDFATLHSFSRVLQTNVDRPVSTHSLLTALESNLKGDTEQGVFYKELLGRLARKKLGGTTTVSSKAGRTPDTAGHYATAHNAIELYGRAFGDPKKLLHTFAHEAVHAATMHEMIASPSVLRKMESLRKAAAAELVEAANTQRANTGKALKDFSFDQQSSKQIEKPRNDPAPSGLNTYGFTNAYEFVAEIESNPEFRKQMQKTKLPDGGTAWEKYLETIAGILGIGSLVATPAGQKEFSKLMMGPKEEVNGA